MISRCVDGPAEGQTFDTRRAPMYLRVVQHSSGTWDALNELEDTPAVDETIYVYMAVPETWSFGFVRPGGRFEGADYRHRGDVDGEAMRDNDAWAAWASSQAPIKMLSDELQATLEKIDRDNARRDERIARRMRGEAVRRAGE